MNDFGESYFRITQYTALTCLVIIACASTVNIFTMRDLNHSVEVLTNELRLLKLYMADEYVKDNR